MNVNQASLAGTSANPQNNSPHIQHQQNQK
jgi:hypothetical protein